MNFKIARIVLALDWDWQEEVSRALVKDKKDYWKFVKKRKKIKSGRKRQLSRIW